MLRDIRARQRAGFAEERERAPCGTLDQLRDRAAVRDEAGFGRAVQVGIEAVHRQARADEIAGLCEPVVFERRVETDEHRVRGILDDLEAESGELAAQKRRAEDEDPRARVVREHIVRRDAVGDQHPFAGDRNAHAGELLQVGVRILRAVVREEAEAAPAFFHGGEEILCVGEEVLAEVDRAVHIEHEAADALQLLPDLCRRHLSIPAQRCGRRSVRAGRRSACPVQRSTRRPCRGFPGRRT